MAIVKLDRKRSNLADDFTVCLEKQLGGYFFWSVGTDLLDVLLPQLLGSLGQHREVFLCFLPHAPGF